MIISIRMQRHWPLFVYFVLALLYTLPLPFYLGSHVPGNNGDSYINLWPFWYFAQGVIGQQPMGFHTPLQFYPDGINLIYTSNSAIGAVLMTPLTVWMGPAVGLNLWILLHLWLGGWFFYRFCRLLGAEDSGAFLGGVCYVASPFVAVHLPGHYTLVQIAYTSGALYSLAALLTRCNNAPDLARRAWLTPALTLAVCTWGVAVTDFYLAVMTLVLLLPGTVLYFVIETRSRILRSACLWKGFAIAIPITLVLLIPWVRQILIARGEHDYAPFSLEGYSSLVARWFRLVNLPQYHPLWSSTIYDWDGTDISRFNEYAYLGIVGFLTAVLGLVLGPHRKRLLVWCALFIIALGLSGGNGFSREPAWTGTPLAFGEWWPQVFPFTEFRVPSRWQFALCTIVAVGVALSVDSLIKSMSPGKKILVPVAIFLLLALDLTRYPLPICEARIIRSGLDTIIPSGKGSTTLDIPVGAISGQGHTFGQFRNETLLRQMSHGLPVLSANVSRLPNDLMEKRNADAELSAFLAVQDGKTSDTEFPELDWTGFRNRYHIRSVRIPKDWPEATAIRHVVNQMKPDWTWREYNDEWIAE